MKLATISRLVLISIMFCSIFLSTATYARAEDSEVLQAMKKELDRSFEKLRNAGEAPVYYLGYRIYDIESAYVSAEYGAINSGDEPGRRRVLSVDLRVGSPGLDNTRKVRQNSGFSFSSAGGASVSVPLEDSELPLRHSIWLATDRAYRKAQERYAKVIANREVNVDEEDGSADFSSEEPQTFTGDSHDLELDLKAWTDTTRKLSAIYKEFPEIYNSKVIFSAKSTKRYLVNSEGSSIVDSRHDYRVHTTAQARASDGMNLWLFDDVSAPLLSQLPEKSRLEKMVRDLAVNLVSLASAPTAEPYAGPAILRSKAAGVFFHEVFGHRMEGHRQKDIKEGRTFTKQIGQRIMPAFISVVDDPTLKKSGDLFLNGFYEFDDEGVPGQKVNLVREGVLESFLMSRSPIEGFPKSNGHGRCAPGRDPVARMGNLIIESKNQVTYEKLREMLIDEVKAQGKPYGLVFNDIAGGFTLTSTSMPQLYSLQPLVVYKVFADGRPDQLVRGVKIVGTPLTALEKIICTSDESGTFNGVCGAESGSVPVSASSPSLLVGTLEVELKDKRQDKPPLLVPPFHEEN